MAAVLTGKVSFAERFAQAFQHAMREEHRATAGLPKVVPAGEGVVDVVDADDKHFGPLCTDGSADEGGDE